MPKKTIEITIDDYREKMLELIAQRDKVHSQNVSYYAQICKLQQELTDKYTYIESLEIEAKDMKNKIKKLKKKLKKNRAR